MKTIKAIKSPRAEDKKAQYKQQLLQEREL